MSAQHTPGRVKVQHPHAGPRGWEVAFEPGLEQLCQDITEDNARRLAACWNACEGISAEALESAGNAFNGWRLASYAMDDAKAQRDELLEALQNLIAWHDAEHNDNREAIDNARAAIAKATA